MIIIKTDSEIEKMRKAGKVVALAHAKIREVLREGITTGELDRIVTEFLEANGAIPAFKGYRGFPASICASVNNEVVHGIPGDRVLRSGDIIGIDIGALVDGYYGDSAWTYPIGEISKEAARLLEVTEASLYSGIDAAKPGNRLSDISHAIQTRVESEGFSVVRDFVGHGVGRQMHEEPQVPNFGRPGTGPRLKKGMTLALEPMVNYGGHEVRILGDNWTVVTADGSLSAHFEHTIAITDGEAEILTL